MSSSLAATKADVVSAFRKSQILTAARDRFARQGVNNTTVDDIAKAAGVAKGTVYLYYKSKDEVLRQLVDADIDELRAVTVEPIDAGGDLESRLRDFFDATLAFYERKRDFIEHCQLELSPAVRKKTRATMARCYQAQVDAWTGALSRAATEGAIGREAIDGAARSIASLARGMAQHRLAGWDDEPIGVTAKRAAALVLKGLATR